MSDTEPVDVGHGMTARLRLADHFPDVEDGTPIGVVIAHPCAARGGAMTHDFIPVPPYPTVAGSEPWTLVSQDPIHIEPSVSYRCCGLHGHLRAGKWEPC